MSTRTSDLLSQTGVAGQKSSPPPHPTTKIKKNNQMVRAESSRSFKCDMAIEERQRAQQVEEARGVKEQINTSHNQQVSPVTVKTWKRQQDPHVWQSRTARGNTKHAWKVFSIHLLTFLVLLSTSMSRSSAAQTMPCLTSCFTLPGLPPPPPLSGYKH